MAPDLPQKFGSYTLHELIARGGMAEIYRATMPGIGGFEKTVAIKKILPHLAEDDEFITMLIDEARIIVSIDHYNIAQVYDLGKIEDSYYIAMEYIHGPDLSDVIKKMANQGRTVPVPHAIYIGSCICAGLHVAHSKTDEDGNPLNIVHRDVSPHNVLLSYAGDVKIIDFGVAKAAVKESKTQMGVIKGKLLYMAPEQAKSEGVDGRSDLFAAGLIMYKMLTNKLPFEGENEFQIYNNILSKDITPPRIINPEVPQILNDIVMKLLARDIDERYQEGYEAKKDLDRALHEVAPGYTVNRLARFIDEHFAGDQQQGDAGADSGPTAVPPQTPSSGPGSTDQNAPPELEPEPLEDDTVNLSGKQIQQQINDAPPAPGGPPQPPGGKPDEPMRASAPDDDTGQFQTPSPKFADSGSEGLSLPPAAIAVVAMGVVVAALAVGLVLTGDDDPDEPAPSQLPAGAIADDSPSTREVSVQSSPPGARVMHNGDEQGTTPVTLEFPEGDSVSLELQRDGFESTTVDFVSGDHAGFNVILRPAGYTAVAKSLEQAQSRARQAYHDRAGDDDPESIPDPEPTAQPAPQPEPVAVPEPQPEPQPEPEPAAQPEPAPEPEPAAEPAPEPQQEPEDDDSDELFDPFGN